MSGTLPSCTGATDLLTNILIMCDPELLVALICSILCSKIFPHFTVKELHITTEGGQTTKEVGFMIGEVLPNGRARDFSVKTINHEIETLLNSLKKPLYLQYYYYSVNEISRKVCAAVIVLITQNFHFNVKFSAIWFGSIGLSEFLS